MRAGRRGLVVALAPLALGGTPLTVSGPAPAGAVPKIAAHRGGARLWPENSLTAFRGALGLGADLLEMDVHLSRDGEAVVIHDPTLDRTTTGRGPVSAHTAAELAELEVRGAGGAVPEGVPRLGAVLDLTLPTGAELLVEIKVGLDGQRYPGIEAKVLAALVAAGLTARATVMAFEWDSLERLRALAPTLRLTGLLAAADAPRLGGVAGAAVRLAALRVDDIGIERRLLSADAVQAAHAAGLTIGVWTINDPDELRRALAFGVDYVTTDRPDLALALRGVR